MSTPPVGATPTSPALVLDGGDRRCVQLLLELRPLTLQAAPGTVIHVRTTDPAAPIDLPAWCHLTGHTYLGPAPTDDRPTYAVQVCAAATVTDPAHPWRPTTSSP